MKILEGKKYRHINTSETNIVLRVGESSLFDGVCVTYRRDNPLYNENGEVYDTHVKPVHMFEQMYKRYEI